MRHDFLHLLYTDVAGTLGIAHLSNEEREELLFRFYALLERRILTELGAAKLQPQLRDSLIELYRDEAVTHEARFASIHNHIPNLTAILDSEIEEFRRELRGSV
jgi:hypothetical protein